MKIYLLLSSLILSTIISAQGVWTQKADFPGVGRIGEVGFSIGTKGYIGTGRTGQYPNYTCYNDFWEWDQPTNVWTQKADFAGGARAFAVGFSIGKKGYIGTGGIDFGWSSYDKDFWEWDQVTNVWSRKADYIGNIYYPVGAIGAPGFSIGTKGYIGTGYDNWYDTLYEWESDTTSLNYNTWTIKSAALTNMVCAVSFSINNYGYYGFDSGGNYSQNIWEWNQLTNTWTQKADFIGPARTSASGFSIGSKGYIGTGKDVNGFLRDFWEWDQVNNSWVQLADFGGYARSNAIGFAIGNKGYIGLGVTWSNVYERDFWEFDRSAVSLNEVNLEESISLYPNPTTSKFQVAASSSSGSQYKVEIYNLMGECIYQRSVSSAQQQIDLSSQPSGIYFIEVKGKDASSFAKIIKQ